MKKIIFIQMGSGQFYLIKDLREHSHYHLTGTQQRKLENKIQDERLAVNRVFMSSACTDTTDGVAQLINPGSVQFDRFFADVMFDIEGVYACMMNNKSKSKKVDL